MPHVRRERVTRHHGLHVTLRLVDGLPSLRRPTHTDLILRVFAAECERKGFRLVQFAIRSNHLHLVCEAESTRALSRGVQRLASRAARGVNRRLARTGRVFRDRFHVVVISKPRQMRNVLRYVLLNESKDRARRARLGPALARHGLARRARLGPALAEGPCPPFQGGIDPWSSAYYFDGFANVGPPPPEPPPEPGERIVEATGPPVTAPRSWLLRVGWRRYGLIDTEEYAPSDETEP